MSEQVIVRQYKSLVTRFWAVDPGQPNSEDFQSVDGLHEATPYGLLLLGIASCTAQVVHSYARHHGIPLEIVELREVYNRNYQDDCDSCEVTSRYEERILEQIAFSGNLDTDQREQLFKIAHQCPIVRMLDTGVEIQAELVEPGVWTDGKGVLMYDDRSK